MQEAEAPSNTPTLLMLDEPRVIAIKDGKFTYSFTFSRISQADWERYFGGIYSASRNDGRAQVNTLDLQTAGIELFEEKLTGVTGYSGDFTSKPGWQKKIPPRHSNQVAWLLRCVVASTEEDEEPCDPESVEAKIDALWSQTTPGADVTMFKGLVHRFAPPTAEQKKRFYRTGAISRIVGGSRNGTTIYGSRSKVMLDLYDQLIRSVGGYGIAGKPLNDAAPEQIAREMDAYHKVEAVSQLFTAPVESALAATEVEAA